MYQMILCGNNEECGGIAPPASREETIKEYDERPFKMRLLIMAMLPVICATANAQEFTFDFGNGPVADGYIGITAETAFSGGSGYGIDSGNVSSIDRGGDDALNRDYLTTTDELFFSVDVPQGNYDVAVIFGDADDTSVTTVKAENRRFLLDRVKTAQGSFLRKTITVRKMETTSIDGSLTMSIKAREHDYYTWDKVLTLRITGSRPAVCGIEITKNDDAITLFLCGNSTVVDQLVPPWSSWGQMIPCLFDSGVAVANYAESGLTSGAFLAMRRLSKLLTEVSPGDYVFVEFGHNDQKNPSDVSNYPNNLETFRDQVTAKGAIPVFVTPTARQAENDPLTSIGGLAQTMRETAQSLGVSCIDLNQMVIDMKKALGPDTRYIYMHTEGDQTHFCEYGAYEIARCVMKGLEEEFPPLQDRFTSGYVTFDPSGPDPLDVLETELPPVSIRKDTPAGGRAAGASGVNNRGRLLLTGHDGTFSHSSRAAHRANVDLNGRVRERVEGASRLLVPYAETPGK